MPAALRGWERRGAQKVLVDIEVTPPLKTQYNLGETALDLTGLVVKAVFDDGSKEIVSDYLVSGFSTEEEGSKTINIEYKGNNKTFTINVIDPNKETAQTPAADPQGRTFSESVSVALSSGTSGAAIYYTTNGSPPTASSLEYSDPITITQTTVLKAIAVKSGWNNSGVMEETYTKESGGEDPVTLPVSGLGVSAQLVIPYDSSDMTAILYIGKFIADGKSNNAVYADPATIGKIVFAKNIADAIKDRTVVINLGTNAAANISLAFVHHLRQAVLESGAEAIAEVQENGDFTPVFDGLDWWAHDGSTEEEINLYKNYSDGTEIMNDIKISKNSVDGKYVIVYDRALTVSWLTWQNNSNDIETAFRGFGLEKSLKGSIKDWEHIPSIGEGFINEKFATGNRYPVVLDFTAYESALRLAGLHPKDDGVLLDHSRVRITGTGGNANIAANGMYDFVLAYYNPAANDTTGLGNRARLPGDQAVFPFNSKDFWSSGLTFDGLYCPADVTVRKINGVEVSNRTRKGGTSTDGDLVSGTGRPNEDFIGNMTVPIANYLRSSLGVSEFRNTNIIGDGVMWTDYRADDNGIIEFRHILTNVGLIGNYNNMSINNIHAEGGIRGVIDILDIDTLDGVPSNFRDDRGINHAYVNIWNNIPRETRITGAHVIHVRGTGGEKIRTDYRNIGLEPARVLIHGKAYIGTPVDRPPSYRAFVHNNIPRITGNDTASSDYLGIIVTNAIPELDETEWIKAFNEGNTPPSTLAANYTALRSVEGGKYVWNNTVEFDNFITAATSFIAPVHSDTKLASTGWSMPEAIMPPCQANTR